MTVLTRRSHVEDPTDLVAKMEALQAAIAAAQQTFEVQFGLRLEAEGMPGRPDATGVLYGSTIALTNEHIDYQYACVFDDPTARSLTRTLFALEADEDVPMEDMADALNEIPNVAAGVWKAGREKTGEHFQLGLPLFLRGHGWITYFPRGVQAIAQKLVGPDGIRLQVVLIWRYKKNSGGTDSMSHETIAKDPAESVALPARVLQEGVQAVVDTCRIQMELPLSVDPNPSDPREAKVDFGSSIALTAENGGWNLAVMGSRGSCAVLTRSLFAMDAGEEPEMADLADAMGEIVNVAAGVLKASRASAGQRVQLGLPLFMEGGSCIEFFASGIQGMAQTVTGPDSLEFHVILIWHEG